MHNNEHIDPFAAPQRDTAKWWLVAGAAALAVSFVGGLIACLVSVS